MAENNYEIEGMLENQIPLLIGTKGKTLFKEVILKSIKEFKSITDSIGQDTIEKVRSNELPIKVHIQINTVDGIVYATWTDNSNLKSAPCEDESGESTYDLNADLNMLIKKNITNLFENISNSNTDRNGYQRKQRFNFKVALAHSKMGEIIGEGGSNIRTLRSTLIDQFKNAFVKVLPYKSDMYEQYRSIGIDEGETVLFKIEVDNAQRSDILVVEEELIHFINEVIT